MNTKFEKYVKLLGKRIKQARKDKGLTGEKLSEACFTSFHSSVGGAEAVGGMFYQRDLSPAARGRDANPKPASVHLAVQGTQRFPELPAARACRGDGIGAYRAAGGIMGKGFAG